MSGEKFYLHKYDKLMRNLFKDESDVIDVLTEDEREMKKRIMAAYTLLLSKPLLTEKEVRKFLCKEFDITLVQSITVMHYTKVALGSVRNANKEWYRYVVAEGFLDNYRKANEAGDLDAANVALDKLAKYMKLDKEEGESLPWDQIIPPEILMTGDVSEVGPFKRVKGLDEKIEQLMSRYAVEAEEEENYVTIQNLPSSGTAENTGA